MLYGISNAVEEVRVFHPDINTPRSGLQNETQPNFFFKPISRCLDA